MKEIPRNLQNVFNHKSFQLYDKLFWVTPFNIIYENYRAPLGSLVANKNLLFSSKFFENFWTTKIDLITVSWNFTSLLPMAYDFAKFAKNSSTWKFPCMLHGQGIDNIDNGIRWSTRSRTGSCCTIGGRPSSEKLIFFIHRFSFVPPSMATVWQPIIFLTNCENDLVKRILACHFTHSMFDRKCFVSICTHILTCTCTLSWL